MYSVSAIMLTRQPVTTYRKISCSRRESNCMATWRCSGAGTSTLPPRAGRVPSPLSRTRGPECHQDRTGELGLAEGLGHIRGGRRPHGPLQGIVIALCRHKDDGEAVATRQLRRKLDAIDRPVERNVDDGEVRALALDDRERGVCGRGHPHHLAACTLQTLRDITGDGPLILDDDDSADSLPRVSHDASPAT